MPDLPAHPTPLQVECVGYVSDLRATRMGYATLVLPATGLHLKAILMHDAGKTWIAWPSVERRYRAGTVYGPSITCPDDSRRRAFSLAAVRAIHAYAESQGIDLWAGEAQGTL